MNSSHKDIGAGQSWPAAIWRRISKAVPLAIPALFTVVLACSSDNPTRPGETGGTVPPVVVALGDSLTAGPGLNRDETYPALLQQRMRNAGYPHRMVNAGVSGDTTADGLRRLDAALVADTQVLIVALGANDGLSGVPLTTVRANLSAIVERAQQRSIRVLLCGMETLPTRGLQYTIDFHNIFPDLAARYGIPLMPFLLSGVAGIPEFNLPDGLTSKRGRCEADRGEHVATPRAAAEIAPEEHGGTRNHPETCHQKTGTSTVRQRDRLLALAC